MLFLINLGLTQQKIGEDTGIEQSSVSRILNGSQKSINYEKGLALDDFIKIQKRKLRSANKSMKVS